MSVATNMSTKDSEADCVEDDGDDECVDVKTFYKLSVLVQFHSFRLALRAPRFVTFNDDTFRFT